MTSQWYELKAWLEQEIKDINNIPYSISVAYIYLTLKKMNELEATHACQSLKEAGY